jgi:hypothetical protein
MNNHFLRLTLLACFALLLTACQPIRPLASLRQPATAANTYTDEQGFFTVDYPADWVAHGYLFAEAPFPNVAIGSHQEIIDLSTAEQLLPADQIGVGLMLVPRAIFAEAGITAETPLAEAAPLLLMAMAGDDAALMAGLLGDAIAEPVTLANGAPAVRLAFDGLTEAYEMTLADLGDGLLLFGSRIEALGHHNAALEAQVDAVIDSFALTAAAEEVMGFVMAQMGAMEASGVEPASEPVRTESGGEVPFYARFGENETFSDGEWAVIVFYRPPDCIPVDFNLNQFFHFPGESDPGAFGCAPPTTTGIETWQNSPQVDPAPLVAEVTGRGAVPVWFVALPELEAAMADGEVTIGELAAAPSLLTGSAATYTELLHPSQSNAAPLIQFAAQGALEDGRPFAVDVSQGAPDVEDHVTIDLPETGAVSAPTVTFTATEYAYTGPESIPGGLTRIELVNAGEQVHMLWLVKLDEGKTSEDLMDAFAAFETTPAFPDWMAWYGGVTAPPGGTAAYTVDLAPGTYTLFSFSEDENGEPDAAKGMTAALTVTEAAETGATPPAADLRIELVDFSFVIEGEPAAGPGIAEVANTGAEPHESVLLRLAEGATVQDAMAFMMAGEEAEGAPPFEFAGGTGPQAAGLTAWYEFDVPPGEYGLICFLPSPANEGAPHFMLGMVQQVSVP